MNIQDKKFSLGEQVSGELSKTRLFLDLDGTAAVFKKVDSLEVLYEKGYFANLEPNWNVINAIKIIIKEHPEIEVFSLSAYLSDSKYALREKNQWMDKYLPEIDKEHRIFMPCGENKLDHIPGGVRETDTLWDDWTHNLNMWEPPARGIKLLNGINHTRETWRGNRLRYDKTPQELAENIIDIVVNGVIIRDIKPQESDVEKLINQMEKNFNELSSLNKTLANRVQQLEQPVEKPQKNSDVLKVDLRNSRKSEKFTPSYFEQNDKKPKM